jgi:hypothetical protein
MRKLLLTVVASCALVAALPATALAHGRHHSRHHGRLHQRTFGSSTSGTTSTPATAGTVQSFTNGVLTILLTNGSTVSGTVTNHTLIVCGAAANPSGWRDHWRGGDDQGHGEFQNAGQSCDPTTALTNGAVVQEAELSVSSAGAVWRKVILAAPSSSSTASSASSSSSSGSCSGQH